MNLTDGLVCVRDFCEQDIENKIKWINNPQNNAYLHYDIPLVYDKTLNWFKNKDNKTRKDCVIEFDGIPVGLIGLLMIDKINQKAEFYITIGDTGFKRKGIAQRATKLLLQYAFGELGLNKVYLNVDGDNTAACMLYEKVGFSCEGVFVQELNRRGCLIDRKRYAIFSSMFR